MYIYTIFIDFFFSFVSCFKRAPLGYALIKKIILYWFPTISPPPYLFHDGGRYHIETSLLCKSMDWFLYDNGLRYEIVKYLETQWDSTFTQNQVYIQKTTDGLSRTQNTMKDIP